MIIQKTYRLEKFIDFPSASRVHEPTSGASRHLLPEEGGKNLSFIIVMEPVKPPEPALFFFFISYSLSRLR